MIRLFFLLIICNFTFAYKVPTAILFSIAKVENPNIFYPYIISINSKKDIKRIKKVGVVLINGRTINCYNSKSCVKATKSLIRAGIINIDLGTFQINYKYHKLPLRDYFNIKKSAGYVDKLIYFFAKRFNKWNWKILAMYHSATPKENKRYILSVNYYYSQIFNKLNNKLLGEYKKFLLILTPKQ